MRTAIGTWGWMRGGSEPSRAALNTDGSPEKLEHPSVAIRDTARQSDYPFPRAPQVVTVTRGGSTAGHGPRSQARKVR